MPTRHLAAAVFAAVLLAIASPAAAQIEAGTLAQWTDLQTWSRYDEAARETDIGLGLVLEAETGTMRLAFSSRVPGRTASRPPASVTMRAAAGLRINPNVLRTPTLRLLLDEKNPDRQEVLDLSSRMTVNDPAPGAFVENGILELTAKEFVRLANAETVTAEIFGVTVPMRPNQIGAIRQLAQRLQLIPSARGRAPAER